MINITKKNFSDDELRELEKASQNLPEKILLICQDVGESDSGFDDMATFFFPYNRELNIASEEAHILSTSRITTYGVLEKRNAYTKEEVYNIDFSSIPEYYNMIDVYRFGVWSENSIDFFVAEKVNKVQDIRILFGYSSDSFDYSCNVFIGTFAKIENGIWKFYPKMKKGKISRFQVYDKYAKKL